MEKTRTVITTTYKTHLNGFYVDIVKTKTPRWTGLHAWIYHNKYGIKLHMFDVMNKTEKDFLEAVEGNIEMYAGMYREQVMDA